MDFDSRSTEKSSIALACVPGGIPPAERPAHFALLNRLFANHAQERRDVAGGYAFRFDAASFDDVARFVARERLCCPFLDFSLELSAQDGPLWLRLTGPDGTREFLDAELPGIGARRASTS
jgi:hypothetical protein